MKIPDPIIDPATSITASTSENARTKPVLVVLAVVESATQYPESLVVEPVAGGWVSRR
jgi:hypothetical protein